LRQINLRVGPGVEIKEGIMSLSKNPKLIAVAKQLCRELRKRSTPAEKVLWESIRNRRINNKKFYRQYPLFFDLNGKETFYIADFFCYEENLVIEIDGNYHEKQKERDNLRTEVINLLGIKVIRLSNDDVLGNTKIVIKKIIEFVSPFSCQEKGRG
jgi:very-short-patch-repair endonuclease